MKAIFPFLLIPVLATNVAFAKATYSGVIQGTHQPCQVQLRNHATDSGGGHFAMAVPGSSIEAQLAKGAWVGQGQPVNPKLKGVPYNSLINTGALIEDSYRVEQESVIMTYTIVTDHFEMSGPDYKSFRFESSVAGASYECVISSMQYLGPG